MLKFAITGNIACGKSTVEKILIKKGYKVLDTDVVGHKLLEDNQEILAAFKDFDIKTDNKISREKLGRIVFSNPDKLNLLNSILHPLIKNEVEKFFLKNINEERVFVSIPLLFEANMQNLFDRIIFVYADDSIRLERLIKRNGYDVDYAQKRLASQVPQHEKIDKCDFVINNNGTLNELETKLTAVLF